MKEGMNEGGDERRERIGVLVPGSHWQSETPSHVSGTHWHRDWQARRRGRASCWFPWLQSPVPGPGFRRRTRMRRRRGAAREGIAIGALRVEATGPLSGPVATAAPVEALAGSQSEARAGASAIGAVAVLVARPAPPRPPHAHLQAAATPRPRPPATPPPPARRPRWRRAGGGGLAGASRRARERIGVLPDKAIGAPAAPGPLTRSQPTLRTGGAPALSRLAPARQRSAPALSLAAAGECGSDMFLFLSLSLSLCVSSYHHGFSGRGLRPPGPGGGPGRCDVAPGGGRPPSQLRSVPGGGHW